MFFRALSIAFLGLSLCACSSGSDVYDSPLSAELDGMMVHTFEQGELTREYIVYTPASYDDTQALPVLFAFHGNGGRADWFVGETDMLELADAENFILVYPQGSLLDGTPHWNPSPPGEGNKSSTDDLAFVSGMLDMLTNNYGVDASRIYACGYSNGAFMTFGLACGMSEHFAAVGGVSGTMLGGTEGCEPAHPMPVISLNGTEDAVVPYAGGLGYPSSDEVLEFWRDFNGIIGEPSVTSAEDSGMVIERTHYEGGEKGAAITRYKFEGGQHVWFTERFEGSSTGQLIWDFVSQYDLQGLRAAE